MSKSHHYDWLLALAGRIGRWGYLLRPCLDREPVKAKKFLRFESSQFEVLNEVYLQNFLHRWVVNRETNLMMLINL